jgi:hypothetical protein
MQASGPELPKNDLPSGSDSTNYRRARPVLQGLFVTATLGAAALLLRAPGTYDVTTFLEWMHIIVRDGIPLGYAHSLDVQPPFYAVLFYFIGHTAQLLSLSPFAGYKLSLLLAWLLTGGALALWTRNVWTLCLALLGFLLGALGLGYFDIFLAPLLLLSLHFLRRDRLVLFAIFFVLFAATKAQGAIAVPIVALFCLVQFGRGDRQRLVAVAAPSVILAELAIVVFHSAPLRALINATHNLHWSGYALNLPWVITYFYRAFRPEMFGGLAADGSVEIVKSAPGYIVPVSLKAAFFAGYAGLAFLLVRQLRQKVETPVVILVRVLFLAYLLYFTVNTGVHENHLFYGALAGVLLVTVDPRFKAAAVYVVLAYNLNMILFFGLTGGGLGHSRVWGVDLSVAIAALNTAIFAWIAFAALKPAPGVTTPGRDAPDLTREVGKVSRIA